MYYIEDCRISKDLTKLAMLPDYKRPQMLALPSFLPSGSLKHRGRNEIYSFQFDLGHGSSTLKFLQFGYQNVVNILFFVVKSLKVTSGFISKLRKTLLDGATIEIFDS